MKMSSYYISDSFKKIYRAVVKDDGWRIRCDSDIGEFIEGVDVVQVVKAHLRKWFERTQRVAEDKMPRRLLREVFRHTRRKDIRRDRQMDKFSTNFSNMKIKGWRRQFADRDLKKLQLKL